MLNRSIFTVVTSRYVPTLKRLLKTAWQHNPDIPFYVRCINLASNEIEQVQCWHPQVRLQLDEGIAFKDLDEERGYAVCSRIWGVRELIEKGNFVLYLDADNVLRSNIDQIWKHDIGADLLVRVKVVDPWRCNAAILRFKPTSVIVDFLKEWELLARKNGLLWSGKGEGVDQTSLNSTVRAFQGRIICHSLPTEFNGLSNNHNSLIWHFKGAGPH